MIAAGEIRLAWRDRRSGARLLGSGMTVFALLVVYSALPNLGLAPEAHR